MTDEQRVIVRLSDENQAMLNRIGDDLDGIVAVLSDLLADVRRLTEAIQQEVAVVVSSYADVGVEAIEDDTPREKPEHRSTPRKVELPREMREPIPRLTTTTGDQRATPFTRASRATQVQWLILILEAAGGAWIAPAEIADAYADSPRHKRYLRNVIPTRMSEMYEDQEAPMERRRSTARGSLYEYRLRP